MSPHDAPVDPRDALIHPDAALEIVLSLTHLLPAEQVPLIDASWRVLAEDFVAPEDHPPFAASTMDGFAVVAQDASPWREVIATQVAGRVAPIEITPGTAARIMTGAPVPPGADAVVRVENTQAQDDHVVIQQESVTPGENIRPIGADVGAGDHLLSAGTVLGPAEIGLLAGFGIDPVTVRQRPRVSVISTGDELVEPSESLTAGQIRDSNRFSLLTALRLTPAEVVFAGKGPDEREPLERLLREAIATSDVVITSGGVSMGELDLVKAILDEIATVHFRRVFMKPGKPLNVATVGQTILFGLPGNPVSALVGFELFIKPAIARLSGIEPAAPAPVRVRLDHEVQPTDRIEYQRAIASIDSEGRLSASTTGAQASSRLVSLVGANILLIVPPRSTPYRPGETMRGVLIGPPRPAVQS